MTHSADIDAPPNTQACADCGTVTNRWVCGWDGRYRCMAHAPNGARGAMARAHHCPSCMCPIPSSETQP